jgi:hypothetical protein
MDSALMYGLLSGRPVRTVYFSTGGFTIEGFNSSTGEFEPEQFLLTRIYVDYYTGEDVDFTPLPKEEFEEYVLNLRKSLGFDNSDSLDVSLIK